MQSWLEGRIWVGKCAQATGMTASLRIRSSKADSNTCESFTRSGLKLESVHQESPRSDVFRKRATKLLLKQKQRQKHLTWAKEKKNWTVAQWSKVLFSDKSKFRISFGNQGLESGGRVERHRIQAAWSPVSVPKVSDDLGCRDADVGASHACSSLKSQSKKIKQVKSSQCLTSSKSSQVLLKIKSSRVKSQFYFYLLRVKLFRLITCVNALTLTALIYTYIYIYIYIHTSYLVNWVNYLNVLLPNFVNKT